MSGSTVGGVLGAVVGLSFGNPQLGWMIGSMIGGVVAPEKIHGPKLTDARSQTAQDGVPRTYGYGTFPCTGNLIWVDPTIHEHKKKEKGKGGPTQITYTYTRSYAIAVCRGPIEGYLIIKRNGKIVYDARTDAELSAIGFTSEQIAETRAAQSKFEQVATFYYGDETQTADATITAVKGVGNVPAYRGTAYIVVTDDDVTELQGAVPQYEFVVRECGTTTQTGGGVVEGWRWLGTGQTAAGLRASVRPMGTDMAWTGSSDTEVIPLNTTASRGVQRYGNKMFAIINNGACRVADVSDITTWSAGPTGLSLAIFDLGHTSVFGGKLWVAAGGSGLASISSPSDAAFVIDSSMLASFGAAFYRHANGVTGYGTNVLAMNGYGRFVRSSDSGATWAAGADIFGTGNRFYTSYGAMDVNPSDGRVVVAGGEAGLRAAYSDNNGASFADCTLPASTGVIGNQVKYCGNNRWLIACRSPSGTMGGLYKSTDNGATFTAVTLPVALGFWIQSKQNIAVDSLTGRVVIAGEQVGPETPRYYYSDDLISWTEISRTGTDVTGIADVYPPGSYTPPTGTELPDAPGWYFDPQAGFNGGSAVSIEGCDLTLDEIVAAECAQRDVTAIDVSQLTDAVLGFRVSTETSPQTNIQSLQSGFMFDGSEYDGVLHFPKRGGPTSFALTVDDLAARDGDQIEWERAQEAELLRKVTVGYIDPATTYTAATQDWERRTGTIQALGEGTMELPVVQDKDWAKQAAEKSLKVGWAETDTCRFSLTRAHSHLVPAQVGTLTDADGVTHRIRITRIEDDGGVRLVEAKRERSNTYNSNAQGAAGPNPGFPGSSLRGPTDAVVMNTPVLRDEDDKPGVYWAARGYLSGWQGAVLQVQRGSDWVTLGHVDAPANMGELLADLPAHAGDVDDTNTLAVKVNDDLASVTFHELLSEKNALAIVNADGTVEVVQVQTWTETAPGEWQGTTLIRGRLDTQRTLHATGSRVVVLDSSVRFAHLQGADLGKTLTFRAVSVGTNPDAAPTFTLTLATMESQREWQPYNVSATKDDDCQWRIDFIGRHRLGTDAVPVASEWFKGWRVSFTLNGVTKHHMTQEQTFLYTTALQEADWGQVNCLGYAVTVSAINEYTGADGAGAPINPGPSIPSPPAVTPTGAPASTTLGPNGGYADDAPHPVPQPSVYGTDLIPDGTLDGWKDASRAPLSSLWKIEGGGMVYEGPGYSTALYEPARLRLSQYPMPRWEVTVTADVQTDLGQTAALGVAWGAGPSYFDTSTAQEYPVETTVTHTYIHSIVRTGLQGLNGEFTPQIAPLLVVNGSSPARASFRNVTMTVEEVPAAVTTATIANLGFASGLTGWTQWPAPNAVTPTLTVVPGGVKATGVIAEAAFTFLINDDPITLVDVPGKVLRMRGEFWSNDPTVYAGRTVRGASLQLAVKPTGGDYIVLPWQSSSLYRGDWTLREIWQIAEIANAGGFTIHLAIRMQQSVGYGSGVRNITVAVTDSVVP